MSYTVYKKQKSPTASDTAYLTRFVCLRRVNLEQQNKMGTAKMGPLIFSMALPAMISMIINALYNIVDSIFVAKYSQDALAAVSLVYPLQMLVVAIGVGTGGGVNSLIARRLGERRQEAADLAAEHGVALAVVGGIAFFILGWGLSGVFIGAFGASEAVSTFAVQYSHLAVGMSIFVMISMMCEKIQQSGGNMIIPMCQGLTGAIINIILDPLMIFGIGPFPEMGIRGAALATVLAQAVSVVVSLLVIRRERDGIALTRGDFRPQRAVMGRILRIGVPVALQDGLIQIAFLFITVIANRRGLTDAAAVGIVEKIISFLFLVPSSMLSTVSALGAQCIGAGKPRRALQTLWYAIAIAFGFGVLITIVIQFVAEPVVSLFTDSAAVAAAGGQYLRGYILDCCFAGLHFCFSGYFCAIGRSELSFLHNITAVVLVRVPGAYLMSKWFPTTLLPMGLATAAGSLLSVIICVIAFLVLRRRGRLVPEEA